MTARSVVKDAIDTQRAIEMIRMGARMQMLEAETGLSRERLLKLYKEVRGESPPKGMLPFSTDWFMSWQQNIHASLFLGFQDFLRAHGEQEGLEVVLAAYRLYLQHCEEHQLECVLSLTRAWTLNRFFDAKMLDRATCTCCGGRFVSHAFEPTQNYVCGLCNMPSRAGKGRRTAEERIVA
ncbi:flagellar transcriptional regulator FlhC [Niveibacterium sp. SC-1]|uniref:flagellar transcriptional regulator FlhC n=1 Tax=Niveibacterium sp. SC-1 TaxID=3135646 RepID=UPI00311DB194